MTSLIHIACAWTLFCTSACAASVPTSAVNANLSAVAFASFEIVGGDQTSDATLAAIKNSDRTSRTSDGKLVALPADELLRRASVFAANRLFPQAREYWTTFIERFPNHSSVPVALFGTGRAFYQERRFDEAITYFQQGASDAYLNTKEGRDSFYYIAPTLLRLERAADAARGYEKYIARFPNGERLENAHLNAIDTWREANNPAEAARVIKLTRERFRGTTTDTNALFARLRLEISQRQWAQAIVTADELTRAKSFADTSTSTNEIAYLRAYGFEQSHKRDAAVKAYAAIPVSLTSYYGGLATDRLDNLGDAGRKLAQTRRTQLRRLAGNSINQYPTAYRDEILRSVRGRAVDPRLILAIMRQESGFRPQLKSPAAARGLMQLTVDTAAKYAPASGITDVSENALYQPATNLIIAAEYLATLNRMFENLPEAVAASYNGGEDNAARWQRRAAHNEPGIFTSEVGFAETKDYVLKVMSNYRAYRSLYTNDLRPQS